MEFICLACEQVMRIHCSADAGGLVLQSARTISSNSLAGSFEMSSSTANLSDTVAQKSRSTRNSTQVARCKVCDGIFHLSCLVEPQATPEHAHSFTCTSCHHKPHDLSTKEQATLSVLIPALAFSYFKESQLETMDESMKVKSDGSSGFTSSIEVGATCRQVQVEANNQISCGKSNTTRPYRRCVALAHGQNTRRRQSVIPDETVVTVVLCDGCDAEFDPLHLTPPLLTIPEGEWFCPACSEKHKCVACDTILNASDSAVNQLGGVILCEACTHLQVGYTRRRSVPITSQEVAVGSSTRKRSRGKEVSDDYTTYKRLKTESCVSETHQTNALMSDNAERRIVIPSPLSVIPSSSSHCHSLDKCNWSYRNPRVIVADPDDTLLASRKDESRVWIICDICFGEFPMIDVLGTDEVSAIPARPWVCKPCARALKRSRKKRPRFSKQMVLEMQAYGRLLRVTAAKVSDEDASNRLGNPPTSREERRKLYELVGKTVGLFLQWDKQWVMGRVVAFHATHPSMLHTILFEDGVVTSLPLYTFPLVIGSRTMVYVKVPALENEWWPAQVLRLNSIAKTLLLSSQEENTSTHSHCRLVRIFTSGKPITSMQHFSSWVPNYLCRSMKRFEPPCSTISRIQDTREKASSSAQAELRAETDHFHRFFQALLTSFRRKLAAMLSCEPATGRERQSSGLLDAMNRCMRIAEVLVGQTINITSAGSCGQDLLLGSYTVKAFEKNVEKHRIAAYKDSNAEILVDLLQGTDGVVYCLENVQTSSEVAILLEMNCLDGTGGGLPGEFHSKELLEDAIIRETGILCAPIDAAADADRQGSSTCSHCLLDAEERQDDTLSISSGHKTRDLIECVKCNRRFHSTCCDPPHAPLSLQSVEDGVVLVSDLEIPFECSECTVCAGCGRRSEELCTNEVQMTAQWSLWRLPLRAAALCTRCIPYFKANRFCSVCNLVLDGDVLAMQVDLLTCLTCNHYVHAACEPDPNVAFHAFSNSSEFTLDVVMEMETLCDTTREAESGLNRRTSEGSRSPSEERGGVNSSTSKDDGVVKSAKQLEEDYARSLRFKAGYDPKVLHHYECLSCRKVRMLHVLYRLGIEDKLDLFKEPVTEAIAPTYFDIIKTPMDLSTIRQNILNNAYTSVNFIAFRDDFELMCLNAVTFNTKERDFLIWREAWRFYGQGQRILRQTAPKARMKQRGGRFYDALKVAAKRQLPNKSGLVGKPSTSDDFDYGGEGGDNEEDDDADEEEDGGDIGSETGSDRLSGAADHSSAVPTTPKAEVAAAMEGPSKRKGSDSMERSETSTSDHGLTGPVITTGVLSTDRDIVTNDASCVVPTKLRPVTSQSRVSLFLLVQTQPSAHTFSWLDLCAVCGSAGLPDTFIFCVDCGEGFHSFCIPGMTAARIEGNNQIRAYWRCLNCKMCEICGQPGTVSGADGSSTRVVATAGNVNSPALVRFTDNVEIESCVQVAQTESLVLCDHCDRGYHGSCLVPSLELPMKQDKAAGIPQIFCASCVTCTQCESLRGSKKQSQLSDESNEDDLAVAHERTYSYKPTECLNCYKQNEQQMQVHKERTRLLTEVWTAEDQKQDAKKCPLCRRKWDADVEELMQCDACEQWVHPLCDPLLQAEPKRYEMLVNDPKAVYACASCRPLERKHVTDIISDGEGWQCQVLLALIQRKRSQIQARWQETHRQLEQVKHWKRLADHTPVYMYVVQLGEECLRTFAYRSLNFQSDWYRLTKQQELDANKVVVPDWLLRKANRYLRFKRYMRGPRAAARRQARKTQNFNSKQALGTNSRQDASSICLIQSEAASCAALLACVHLLYGWRPLPEVVIHLLSMEDDAVTGHKKLDQILLEQLRSGGTSDAALGQNEKLAAEIAMIKEQYARRANKHHVVHNSPSDLPVSGVERDVSKAEPEKGAALAEAVDDVRKESGQPSAVANHVSLIPATNGSRLTNCVAWMTTASPLHGWPSARNEKEVFEDTRFCALCFMIGDQTACGRLLYTESETWVHVNCALWSTEVHEDAEGVLHKCSKARHRSRLIRCDACGLMGATIGCAIARCARHYHFPCAVDAGAAFLPTGETCCPVLSHKETLARRLEKGGLTRLHETEAPFECVTAEALSNDAVTEYKDVMNEKVRDGLSAKEGEEYACDKLPNADVTDASNASEKFNGSWNQDKTAGMPLKLENESNVLSTHVLPVINPCSEPRRALYSDRPLVTVSDLKKKKRAELKRGIKPRPMCYRIGALTLHSLGHIFVGNASFHTRTALYPLGFRSTRIFWSTRDLATRCLYECVITSTARESQHAELLERRGTGDRAATQERRRPRVVFQITASDDQARPIVACTPDDALIELRSRVVSLYEEHRGFGAASPVVEKNPFLKRSSWSSFALSGAYFFGFGLPEILQSIEELPHAATTAVSRRATIRKVRQQQQRHGQSPLAGSAAAIWSTNARKRTWSSMETSASNAAQGLSTMLDEEPVEEELYEFAYSMPSVEAFEAAERVMEQLVRAEQRARQSSGCARTDGFEGNRLFGAPKKAKIMPRRQALSKDEPVAIAPSTVTTTTGVAMDIEHLPITMQYRELRRRPFDERMLVRKSSIHGYGLFMNEAVSEGQMIVEYQGQIIDQSVADERERRYEEQGVGSCYMFRVDDKTIIDATRCGNLARFINHSCDPKAFARIVAVDGGEKKIVIFAKRAIAVGDEVTYDYKFPIEDEAIRCDCMAMNCIGRMN
ncbi:hypothetical protein CCR75_006616 [Bremia lactucae]|uniref:Histone-lysine N-methyltransferase n=1 Tax=Bremia lactucae TaxID=4779 RepID=A0A976FH24_BRELC|nr:hypothetical protein CCR75_006616 [Bremia lactucae]